jgi:hypothetical protein
LKEGLFHWFCRYDNATIVYMKYVSFKEYITSTAGIEESQISMVPNQWAAYQ